MNAEELRNLEAHLSEQFDAIKQRGLNLDLTRGKPSTEQLNLSNGLLGDIGEKALADASLRNYGGLLGLPAARELFSQVIGVKPEETLVGGNSSLTLMYFAAHFAMHLGVKGPDSAWMKQGQIKMLFPEHAGTRSQDLEEVFHDAGQFYWGKTQAFLDNLPMFSEYAIPPFLPRSRVMDLDDEEDWFEAELMFQAHRLRSAKL